MFDCALLKLPGIRGTLLVLAFFSLFESACILGQAIGLSRTLVALWEGATIVTTLKMLSLFACSFVGVRIVLNLRKIYIGNYAYKCATRTRRDLLDTVFRTGAPAVQAFGTGTTAAMVLEGIDKVQSYLELVLPKMINMVVLPVVFAISITVADWVSGIAVIIALPAMVLLMILIGRTTADRGKSQHAVFKMMSNHFVDSVRGVSTLNTFEISRSYAKRVFDVSERFRAATMQTLKTATLSGAVLDLFATLALAAVSIMLGLRLIDGSLTLLPALFVLILVPEYFRPIREFAADYHASLDGVNSLHTILDIVAVKKEIPPSFAMPPWRSLSTLEAHHIAKDYDSVSALNDISFKVEGYERVGVIGVSGSGKSTLLRILAGLEDPSFGTFTFDSMKAFDTLRHSDWEKQIAYIPQDPYIFHATLRENLTFYNPEASETRIWAAVVAMGLSDLVRSLPQGLDSVIGEAGRGLSGGQAQRIALARAFLDERREILLFDEPTAHLDIETEYELKKPMVSLMENKLVLFATHRLHWLDVFDYVIVFQDGVIIEQGPVEHLKLHGEHFNQLITTLRGGDVA